MSNIALVGNGISLVGMKLGAEIDAHDRIVRFPKAGPDLHGGFNFEDLGLDCDVMCLTPRGLKDMPANCPYPLIIYDKKFEEHGCQEWLNRYKLICRADRAHHVSRGAWFALHSALQGIAEIDCYGFDNIRDSNNTHYRSYFRDRPVDSTLHDYAAEKIVLDLAAEEYGVAIRCLPVKQ